MGTQQLPLHLLLLRAVYEVLERGIIIGNNLYLIYDNAGDRIIRADDRMNKLITFSDSDCKYLLSVLYLDSLTGNKQSKDLYNKLTEQYARQTTKVDLGNMIGEIDCHHLVIRTGRMNDTHR